MDLPVCHLWPQAAESYIETVILKNIHMLLLLPKRWRDTSLSLRTALQKHWPPNLANTLDPDLPGKTEPPSSWQRFLTLNQLHTARKSYLTTQPQGKPTH